jgi:hypothetical protein
MASRWAYEGMMVNFYKDNPYNRSFFSTQFRKHEADNRYIYLIPELEGRLRFAQEYATSSLFLHKDKIASDLEVVRHELENENHLHPGLVFPQAGRIHAGCSPQLLQDAELHLGRLRSYYAEISAREAREETRIYNDLVHRFRGSQNLNEFRLGNHNRAIERYLKNSEEEKKIIETGGRLIQMADPVYKNPSGSNRIFSRAHFFSPYKYLLGMRVETPVFNILVLWMMTGFLYLTLYFNGLRKLLEWNAFRKKHDHQPA